MPPQGGEIQPPTSNTGVIFEDIGTPGAVGRLRTPSALRPIQTSSDDRFRGMIPFRRIGMVVNMPEGIDFNDAKGMAA